jgi:hypothetical protein
MTGSCESTSRRSLRRVAYCVTAALCGLPSLASAQVFSVTSTVNIPGAPLHSFDISYVDPLLQAYFLADRSNKSVDVISASSHKVTHQFTGFVGFTGNNNTSGPNGLLTVTTSFPPQIWVGDGDSTIKVLSYPSGTLLHNISTGGTARADELCYDTKDRLILMANDADNPPFITFIPTLGTGAYTVVKTLKFPEATNGIEQCQWSPFTGMFYLNIPEVNGPGDDTKDGAVYVIDPKTKSVVNKYDIPVSACAGPQGMALGPFPNILLGCNAPSIPSGVQNSVVINALNGAIVSVLGGFGGADEVWAGAHDYFIGAGSKKPVSQLDIANFGNVETQIISVGNGAGHAHSVAADSRTNTVYFPIPDNAASTICPTPSTGCVALLTTH